ncbi:MAG: hypothetical protein M9932_04295 [Xanthobacteraceae bacterium]|nr:hypothetical protein [Xanthobacteraceae bacterium]
MIKQWMAILFCAALITTTLPASADDAATIAAATKLNTLLSETFDKTGKFPADVKPTFHATVLKALTLIPNDSPQHADAAKLRAAFEARQPKINKIGPLKYAAAENPKIKIGQLDKSYGMLKGPFILENPNTFPIADVQVSCSVYASSGTAIKEYNFTVYEAVPAKDKKRVTGFNFGFWPDQGKSISCNTVGYQKR